MKKKIKYECGCIYSRIDAINYRLMKMCKKHELDLYPKSYFNDDDDK